MEQTPVIVFRRKLQRVGNSWMISVPIEWVEQHFELCLGNKVQVGVMPNGNLEVSPLAR